MGSVDVSELTREDIEKQAKGWSQEKADETWISLLHQGRDLDAQRIVELRGEELEAPPEDEDQAPDTGDQVPADEFEPKTKGKK